LLAIIFSGCSAEKEGWAARNWHNMLAKYNGYFLAREKMKEVDMGIKTSHKDNYNRIIPIYPTIGPATATSNAAALDDIIKKASLPIQRHKNSDWVDDSYILIGKARLYKDDPDNAVHTFKFVNTKSRDKDARHEALNHLLRTYVHIEDFIEARSLIGFLSRERMNEVNLKRFYLNQAYYFYKQKEYKKVGTLLETAVPMMRRGDEKARLSYAAGQIFQRYKDDQNARLWFKQVLKNNPPYELGFYARLNLALVIDVQNPDEVKRIKKRFKKMLKDPKNLEYRDITYYQMGLFEERLNNLPKAIEHFKKSLKQTTPNPNQKAYTYLKLAEVHYRPLKKYVISKNYYDSCVAILDTLEENYKQILKRQKVLAEFVTEYEIIEREDSLLKLSQMDSTQLFALIDKKIEDAAKAKKVEEKRLAKLARQQDDGGGGNAGSGSDLFNQMVNQQGGGQSASTTGGTWYFYNQSGVVKGQQEFTKKWGRRKLEDNWRVAAKEKTASQEEGSPENKKEEQAPSDLTDKKEPEADNKAMASTKGEGDDKKSNAAATVADPRSEYLKDIPSNPAAVDSSKFRLRRALLKIGKIYDQKLEEPENAIASFERLPKEFPEYDKVPEALYNLYLIYGRQPDQPNQDRVKEKLLTEFPESVYAKLVLNPNYLVENKQRNEQVGNMYRGAYSQYEQGLYIEASQALASIKKEYPKNDHSDRIDLLNTLIAGATLDLGTYRKSINEFLTTYPKSSLVPFAKEMKVIADKYAGDTSKPAVANDPTSVSYSTNFEQAHLYLAVVPLNKIPEGAVKSKFSDFNYLYFPSDNLTTTTLLLNDGKHYVVKVQSFNTKYMAMSYFDRQKADKSAFRSFPGPRPIQFVISQENFVKFYNSKDVSKYLEFFSTHYNMEAELEEIPSFGN